MQKQLPKAQPCWKEVFPEQPIRQWVLSLPYVLRCLFASRPGIMCQMPGIVYRVKDER
jgi:hypothetical protein